MGTPLSLLLWVVLAFTQADTNCPQQKTVGGTCFTRAEENINTSFHNCTSNCSYTDESGDMFCFKEGPYKVEETCKMSTMPKYNETKGELCNRKCTDDLENRSCSFTFVLEQLLSDTTGRLADGKIRPVLVYNGQLVGPTIAVCAGDKVVITLVNRLKGTNATLLGGSRPNKSTPPYNSSTLHFHGIREKQPSNCSQCGPGRSPDGGPWSDGVPLVTQCPTPAGHNFTYTFSGINGAPAGTYWYHSHVGRQRMNGAEGKLIIMERTNSNRFDVDLPENSLFLQEWYPDNKDHIPCSLLVNGKGKQSEYCPTPNTSNENYDYEDFISKYKGGKPVEFQKTLNPDYFKISKTNYEVFNITEPGKRYRFRIIGGIGDDVPIRVSIEGHKFSVIATDAVDVESHENIDAVWVAAGERYDIVINTTATPQPEPYKINVYHKKSVNSGATITLCSLAWLKYSTQVVDDTVMADCKAMGNESFNRVLNPVPNNFSDWGTTEYIYPVNLTAKDQAHTLHELLNTQYITIPVDHNDTGYMFNNFTMSFPDNYSKIPFLFQSPSNETKRCGVRCGWNWNSNENRWNSTCEMLPEKCGASAYPKKRCACQHVIQQPWFDSSDYKYWFEIILINNHPNISHPIHHHGGWFNILGMGQFDHPVYRETIMEMDTNCHKKKECLPRNYKFPVFKDVIQVPTNGYVIFRAPIDNRGTWIVHCHINWHIEHGMAMVFQIGEPDGPFRWSMGPNETTAQNNKNLSCKLPVW